MLTSIRAAVSSVGGTVNRLFHHDRDLKGNKPLALSIPPTSKQQSRLEAQDELSEKFPSAKPGAVGRGRVAQGSRAGGNTLPSPPPSPTKREARRQSSKARRFMNKFRSESLQDELGASTSVLATAAHEPSRRKFFKERRRRDSRQTPKRAGHSRLPMPVRFTETTPVKKPERKKPAPVDIPDLGRLTLGTEPTASTPAEKRFADRLLSPPPEDFGYVPSLKKARLEEKPVDFDECIAAILDDKPPWGLELNSTVTEDIEAQRKARVSDEDITREHITNLQKYDIREPLRPLLVELSEELKKRTVSTVRASPDAVLAKAADSTPLHRHDFCRVIPKTEWLNDEIVNGVLSWLDQAVNHIAGVDDPKAQTRKCLVMTSFYYKQIKTACKNTQRALKRKGVTKDNLLQVNTILLPICEHSHWTLMVICPSKRTVAHVDSLNPRGTRSVTELALRWMQDALDDRFVAGEWSAVRYEHPAQTNGYDCGVHTICNAICVATGVNALGAYRAVEMPALRVQMSAVLVNGGFSKELDLLGL